MVDDTAGVASPSGKCYVNRLSEAAKHAAVNGLAWRKRCARQLSARIKSFHSCKGSQDSCLCPLVGAK
jgi:hypothetical protein